MGPRSYQPYQPFYTSLLLRDFYFEAGFAVGNSAQYFETALSGLQIFAQEQVDEGLNLVLVYVFEELFVSRREAEPAQALDTLVDVGLRQEELVVEEERPTREEREESLHEQVAKVALLQNDVFGDVGDDVQAVQGQLLVYEVHEERNYDLFQLEALHELVFVGSHQAQVSQNQHDHAQMLDQLELADLLVQSSDHLLPLPSQLGKGVLLLLLDVDGLAASLLGVVEETGSLGLECFEVALGFATLFVLVLGVSLLEVLQVAAELVII